MVPESERVPEGARGARGCQMVPEGTRGVSARGCQRCKKGAEGAIWCQRVPYGVMPEGARGCQRVPEGPDWDGRGQKVPALAKGKASELIFVKVSIAEVEVDALVDTGATTSCRRWDWYQKWKDHLGALIKSKVRDYWYWP